MTLNLAAAGGLRLVGRGARGAERALTGSVVEGARSGRHHLLIARPDLDRLAQVGLASDKPDDQVIVEPDTVVVVARLRKEVLMRCAADAHHGNGQPYPPLVAVLDPLEHEQQFLTELEIALGLPVGAIVLGDWDSGTTLVVEPDGMVSDAVGPAASGLVGVTMAVAEVAGPLPDASPAVGDHDEVATARASNTPSAAAFADSRQGRITVLGSLGIDGPGLRVTGGSADMWSLLGFLVENRNILVSRQRIEDRLWPAEAVAQDRFPTLMKETRAKLCASLSRPTSDGKYVISYVVNAGYRISSELFTVDVWQLRDVLAAAAAAVPSKEKAVLLARAADLYAGPFLPECTHAWAKGAARALARDVVQALAQLAELEADPSHAVTHLERACDIDPNAEYLYRQRMEIYARLGRSAAIHGCFAGLADRLKMAGCTPEPKTIELFDRITSGG